ncbi:glycoside hydrolase family 38 N-terminal domain-containing protein [Lyngbya aestuarii]|uniref:glycoside hydrolase family 38 N-terminal domain-containing protein n=1 Tax=Lyngbya aestuarii TaxID=118322 RepID=UPI00403D798E
MTQPVTSNAEIRQINEAVDRLLALTQVKVQNCWLFRLEDLPVAVATQSQRWQNWSIAQPNSKGYIIWSAGHQVIWLGQSWVIPQDLQGYILAGSTLRLVLTWWAQDAQIFVNGQLVHTGDLFDSSARVVLSSAVVPGEEVTVALRLVSPGHDIGGLMRSFLLYEARDQLDPGFVANELAVLCKYVAAFEPEKLGALATTVAEIDWEVVSDQEKFACSLSTLRRNLQALVEKQHVSSPKQRRIQMLGHAHLDMAWLWTVSETWDVAVRTFTSVLQLQQEFPSLTFCHTTPALYSWIEQHRPDLFAAIKQQIAAGRWEIVGGMWVEPELNLINTESIVRQVLYAQRYVQEKFGQLSKVAWVTDSFGFPWQLPQILKQGGIEYLVTQKLHWNDTTKFPYGAFWWQSPDGSQIFSIMSPPNITGVMDTNPITMADYAIDWEIQTNLQDAFWLPGVGDHGGGPSRDMLEVAARWQHSPFFPRLEFTTAESYLQQISSQLRQQQGDQTDNQKGEIPSPSPNYSIPIWNDELYLEFHRGCYTTHADQKRWNRLCEGLLYQAELFASLATIITGISYPKRQLEQAWKKLLFNQFHDILPGTSIPEVFVEANQAWQEVEQVASEILAESLGVIASQITLPSPPQPDAQPLVVFNPLNWQRSEIVAVALNTSTIKLHPDTIEHWQVYDLSGQEIPSQLAEKSTLLFEALDVPSVGYRVFWLCCGDHGTKPGTQSPADFILENENLRVIVDPDTGNLTSVFDKIHQREVIRGAGNQLQAFQDEGQYWDAWNIDPNYEQHRLPSTQLKSIQWIERGWLRQRLRVVRQLGQSQFQQDYILDTHSQLLKIETVVDWQEKHVLVKAAFPLNLETNQATYEIAGAAIQRPTNPQTAAEGAKWEVPALHWADLSESTYGVSLLNDGKYGYDAQSSQLRLTLLRSPTWPDPQADLGIHQFTYALYPHGGNWSAAGTVQRGYELNLPLQVVVKYPLRTGSTLLNPISRLLDLSSPNLVLQAVKQSEDFPEQWIVRCYECQGESANFSLEGDLNLRVSHAVDLLERQVNLPQTPVFDSDEQYVGETFQVAPWQIASFRILGNLEDFPASH